MTLQVIFPSLEQELIRVLDVLLPKIDSDVTADVFTSVLKQEYDKQVIVRSDGGVIRNRVMKEESFGINIWAKDFETASSLAQYVEALLPLAHTVSGSIKKIEIGLSSTRVINSGSEEQRYITGTAFIIGSELKFKS